MFRASGNVVLPSSHRVRRETRGRGDWSSTPARRRIGRAIFSAVEIRHEAVVVLHLQLQRIERRRIGHVERRPHPKRGVDVVHARSTSRCIEPSKPGGVTLYPMPGKRPAVTGNTRSGFCKPRFSAGGSPICGGRKTKSAPLSWSRFPVRYTDVSSSGLTVASTPAPLQSLNRERCGRRP